MLFILQVFAYVLVVVIAITSYVVIGIIYCVFPVVVLFVLMKSLWYKTYGKLEYLLKRGK